MAAQELARVLCLRCGQWEGFVGARYVGRRPPVSVRLPSLSLCFRCSMDPVGRGLARLQALIGSDVDEYLGTRSGADL